MHRRTPSPSTKEVGASCVDVVKEAGVLGARTTSLVFGLPKHSSPSSKVIESRVKHLSIPQVIAMDSNTLRLPDSPLQFRWQSCESTHQNQLLEVEQSPESGARVKRLQRIQGAEKTKVEADWAGGDVGLRGEPRTGPASTDRPSLGVDIQDLFAHSYTPHTSSTCSGWFWIQTSRVWD